MEMEYTAETAQFLSQCFLQTLVPNPEHRRQAEVRLKRESDRPGYGITILQFLSDASVDKQVRGLSAVNFKNHVRNRWAPSDPDSLPESPLIQDPEKEQIKTLIVRSMLTAHPHIQSQLSEGLAIISKHDFPKTWQTLLPELVTNLQSSADYAVINGILNTANSIFKKFRYQYKSNDLYIDLKYCLDRFAAPLLEVFLRTGQLIVANMQNVTVLRPLFECQRLCCRVFYSLNFQELPEFFENHMKEWMGEFRTYLTTPYPVLEDAERDKESIVDQLRAAICENINLYMEKKEEEFQEYLKDFASAVWSLLMNVSTASSRDRLAVTAIKFLTTVSKSVHHTLFSSVENLPQIWERIVVPNVMIREDDEELFEMNHMEYIRRDIEGSDLDTRRRIACELVKVLATHYKEQVMGMVSKHIKNIQTKYVTNPAENWKEKDCAIYLVVSLSTKQTAGVSVSTELINFEQFISNMIMPELQSEDVNAQPLLRADALKFLTTFRHQICTSTSALDIMPHLTRFLLCESNVVHSYAANCIEKMLPVKAGQQAGINHFVQPLMTNLFNALKLPESQENPYVMKCIMRVVGIADLTGDLTIGWLTGLTSILNEVCMNPKNPSFNHYLFESVAALMRRSCERDPGLIASFEANLFPVLHTIWVHDVTEFVPYALQLLAQLIEINQPQAYLQRDISERTQEWPLRRVLGIWSALFIRLPNQRTVKSFKSLIIFMSLFLVKNEPGALADSINSVQTNSFPAILEQFWVITLKSITGFVETRVCSYASTRLLCASPTLWADTSPALWGKMLDGTMNLLARPEEDRVEEEIEMLNWEGTFRYGLRGPRTFAHLLSGLFSEQRTKFWLVFSLARLSETAPGKYPSIIEQSLEPANQAALAKFCNLYGSTIA